jgi:hypothetical protein
MILRWLMSAIGFATLKGEASQLAARVAKRTALAAAMAVLWLIAFSFALAALTVWLSQELGAAAALAIIAAALAVIGLALQVTLALGRKRRPPPAPGIRFPGLGASDGTAAPPGEGQAIGSLAVIALTGYLLARQLFRK